MTALVRILSYVRVNGRLRWRAFGGLHRKWIIPQIYHKPTWKSVRICPVMMLDAENINIAVGEFRCYLAYKLRYMLLYTLPITCRHL